MTSFYFHRELGESKGYLVFLVVRFPPHSPFMPDVDPAFLYAERWDGRSVS